MPELTCTACGHDFDREDEARCPKCLKKSTVVPWSPPGREAGERHRRANAWLMAGMVAVHVLTALSVAVNLLLELTGKSEQAFGAGMSPATAGEQAGYWSTYVCVGGFALVGLAWAPINAWGLFKRRRWARTSSIAYWAASLLTCCCIPMGAYGLWSLMRKDVAAFFED